MLGNGRIMMTYTRHMYRQNVYEDMHNGTTHSLARTGKLKAYLCADYAPKAQSLSLLK